MYVRPVFNPERNVPFETVDVVNKLKVDPIPPFEKMLYVVTVEYPEL